MAIICISRMYGAGGTEFAKRLSQCLNYKFIDKECLNKQIKNKDEFPFISDITDEEGAPSFLERFEELFTVKSFYKSALSASICDLALKGNIVFVGRAAHIVLEGIENVVSIQIVAKMADRIKRVADIKKISPEEAFDLIKERDKEKNEFINYYFDRELLDPLMFFFVFNFSHINIEEAVELTCNFVRKYNERIDEAKAIEHLQNRLIEKRAELILFKNDLLNEGKIELEASKGGKKLVVKGIVSGEETKQRIIKSLKKLKEVEHIEDVLKKGVLSRSIF